MKKYTSVAEYIDSFPASTRKLLKKMRTTIKKAAPRASERIAYGIPTFTGNGNIVHYGAFPTHISFFPGGKARDHFKELKKYKGGKGTVQFPIDKPIPWALITKIAKFNVKADAAKAKSARTK